MTRLNNALNNGRVKFFNTQKGFGFITDTMNPTMEYFFHISGTLDRVEKDDEVSFNLEKGKRGLKAINVKKV